MGIPSLGEIGNSLSVHFQAWSQKGPPVAD